MPSSVLSPYVRPVMLVLAILLVVSATLNENMTQSVVSYKEAESRKGARLWLTPPEITVLSNVVSVVGAFSAGMFALSLLAPTSDTSPSGAMSAAMGFILLISLLSSGIVGMGTYSNVAEFSSPAAAASAKHVQRTAIALVVLSVVAMSLLIAQVATSTTTKVAGGGRYTPAYRPIARSRPPPYRPAQPGQPGYRPAAAGYRPARPTATRSIAAGYGPAAHARSTAPRHAAPHHPTDPTYRPAAADRPTYRPAGAAADHLAGGDSIVGGAVGSAFLEY